MNPEEIIKDADANDGLTVEKVDLGEGSDVSLHFAFREGGVLVKPPLYGDDNVEFWARKKVTPADQGEASRLEHVMKSVCRFLNTGGAMMQLMHAISILSMIHIKGGGDNWRMEIPGYYLLNTRLNDEGEYEHLFADEAEGLHGILWVEGRYIEVVSLVEIANNMRKEASSAISEMELLTEAGAEPAESTEGEPSP